MTVILPTTLPVTLGAAAAASFINVWLMVRIGQIRRAIKCSVGDGGDERLIRRMRAQANFIEAAPLVLILLGVIELAKPGHWALLPLATLFALSRVAHGLGMDGGNLSKLRSFGTIASTSVLLGLGGWALALSAFAR